MKKQTLIYWLLLVGMVLASCKHKELPPYPPVITANHWEKKYDNALWMFYASNYHQKVYLIKENKMSHRIEIDSNPHLKVASIEPRLIEANQRGDKTEFAILLARFDSGAENWDYHLGKSEFVQYDVFGFENNSDTVTYRCGDIIPIAPELGKNMWNRKDSAKKMAIMVKHISLPMTRPDGSLFTGPLLAFQRTAGEYPIDEQDSLFRIYVKVHKNELAPTLLRICKEKGIF